MLVVSYDSAKQSLVGTLKHFRYLRNVVVTAIQKPDQAEAQYSSMASTVALKTSFIVVLDRPCWRNTRSTYSRRVHISSSLLTWSAAVILSLMMTPSAVSCSSLSILRHAAGAELPHMPLAWKKPLHTPAYLYNLCSPSVLLCAPLHSIVFLLRPLTALPNFGSLCSAPTVKFRISRTNGGQINHTIVVKMWSST